MKAFYITTAIPYLNAPPHLGHAEDYILSDVCARYQRLLGKQVRFQVGTDEHGGKIQKKAKEQNVDVKLFVDKNADFFRDFIKKLGVEYTDFIRTTDEIHTESVKKIWKKLKDHIYKHTYEGWYCEGCERFVTDKEYEENNGVCPDHKAPYQRLSEENYYFKLSDFKEQIRKAIETDRIKILPDFRKKETLKLLEDSRDVSISRPIEHLQWGIPVPDDEKQVMYVWIDALSNYITVLGYPDKDVSDFWPADVQVVGKDILRFHAILWPAILLGLGLELPKTILSHGFILANGQKMSKSIGNVVDPIEVLNKYGLDAFRYYFTRYIDTFADSDFTWEKYENAYKNELANDFGNLVQRLSSLCQKNAVTSEILAKNYAKLTFDSSTKEISGLTFDKTFTDYMDNYEFTNAIEYAWEKIQDVNKRIEETKPWVVAKENPEEAKKLLTSLVEDLLIANHHLKPFLPITEVVENIFMKEIVEPPVTPLFPKD